MKKIIKVICLVLVLCMALPLASCGKKNEPAEDKRLNVAIYWNANVNPLNGWGGWWTWVIVTGLYGLFVGLGCKGIDLEDGVFSKKEFIRFSIVSVVSCILCWGVLAPIGDILIYAEPANLVFIQGLFVGLSGMIASIVVGGILCKAYAASRAQKGSLTKED